MIRRDRIRLAARAASVAAAAGLIGLVTLALFLWIGQPFGTINDVALLVMMLAIAPIMLGSYELGGLTPLLPAQLSLAAGVGAVTVWSAVQIATILGLVTIDVEHAATGAYAIEAIALVVIGAWLTGASLLAGSWLAPLLRALGAIAGIGFIVYAVGLLRGGVNDPLTYAGGIGYLVLFPVWAYLFARGVWAQLRTFA
jgi:hypothetical protein